MDSIILPLMLEVNLFLQKFMADTLAGKIYLKEWSFLIDLLYLEKENMNSMKSPSKKLFKSFCACYSQFIINFSRKRSIEFPLINGSRLYALQSA